VVRRVGGSLRASLIEAAKDADISGSLVVTPEAFNVRKGYWYPDRELDPSIRIALTDLSTKFKIALVTGLIEEGDAQGPGYSSAYLIDGQASHLLTRKMENDGSENYRCCTEDFDKPVEYGGLSQRNQQQAAVLEQMALHGTKKKLLCVPSHMMSYGSKEVALAWPVGVAVVVANSSPKQPSVLRFGTEARCCRVNESVVKITDLP
jgi:hypothetical protein